MPIVTVPGVGDVTFPDSMSQDQILSAIENDILGGRQAQEQSTAPLPVQQSTGYNWTDLPKDALVTLAKTVVGTGEAAVGLADLATLNQLQIGKFLEDKLGWKPKDAQRFLEEQYSAETQKQRQAVGQAQGFVGKASELLTSPAALATKIGESVGPMFAGGAGAKVLRAVAPSLGLPVAAGLGEGAVGGGSALEQLRQESQTGTTSGRDWLAAMGTAGTTAVFGTLGGKIANSKLGQKLGIADIDSMIASGKISAEAAKEMTQEASSKGLQFLKTVAASGFNEGVLEEMPQSVFEQVWSNWAKGKPLDEGLPEAAAEGLITGKVMGAGAGALRSISQGQKEPAPELTEFDRRRKEMEEGAPTLSYFDEAHPIDNPYGNIPAQNLGEVADQINAERAKKDQPPLSSFSMEDIVESGLPKEQVDAVLSGALNNVGLFPDQTIEPQDIQEAAEAKGLDTASPGFQDFLRRSSGSSSPTEMTPVQRVAAFGAIQNLPEGVDSLSTGTNAQSFTQKQYDTGLKAIKGALSVGVSREGMLDSIRSAGIDDSKQAQSILHRAIRSNEVGAVSIPSFDVYDGAGKKVRSYETPEPAQALAGRLNGEVRRASSTKFVDPAFAGMDIRPGTYRDEPTGFEVRAGDTVISKGATLADVEARADRLQQIRDRLVESRKKQLESVDKKLTDINEPLDVLEAQGLAEGPEYKKLQKKVQGEKQELTKQKDRLNTEVENLSRPLRIASAAPVQTGKKGFTRFENNRPVEYLATLGPLPKPTAPTVTEREAADIDALREKLLPALKRFGLESIGLRVVKSIEDGGAGADGAYVNSLIQIALSAENPMGVMRHEVIHALKELGAFTSKEWRVLENKAKSEWIDRFIRKPNLYERYQDAYEKSNEGLEGFDEYIAEEAIAEAFKYFDATKPPPGLVGNLFGRIRNFFASLKNALQGAGFQTAEEVLGRIEEGKVTPKKAEAPAAEPRYSRKSGRREKEAEDAEEPKFSLAKLRQELIDKAFSETADAQRFGTGLDGVVPEKLGTYVNFLTKASGKLQRYYEHIGDLVNRAAMPSEGEAGGMGGGGVNYGLRALKEKVNRALNGLADIRKDGLAQVQGNAEFLVEEGEAKSVQDFMDRFYKESSKYADAYQQIPVYTELQALSKRAAVVLGKLNFDSLESTLRDIKKIIDSPNAEEQYYTLLPEKEQLLQAQLKAFSPAEKSETLKFSLEPTKPEPKEEPRILSNGNIVGAPPGARTVEARNKLVKRMTNLLSHPYSLYDDSKDWYERSGATIREITRGNPELTERTVRLMALYSQANSLGANTTATIKSIAQLASGDKTAFAGRFPNTTAERIPAILAAPTMDASLPGVDDKLMNFYRNLHDATYGVDTFQDASTVDRWMMRLFGYPHSEDQEAGGATGVSNTQYIYAKDLIRRISDANKKRNGEELKPRQVQAVMWTYVKNTTDYNSLDPKKKAKFEPSTIDFSDYITRATANITWESRPSTKLPLIPGIHKASRAEQENFNRSIREIFIDPKTGNDKIFELLGNQQLYSSQFSIGAYENLIAPNVITKLVLQKDNGDYMTDVANKYAAIIGYVTKQDAVPWYRADPTASGKDASKGYRVTATNAEANSEFEDSLFKHLNENVPGIGFTRVGNSFDFINFRDTDTGKPYMMSDKQYFDRLQGALESFDRDVKFEIEPFRAKSGWISNDWTENTNGQSYLERFSPTELANIRRDIEGWSKDYDRIAEQYGKEYGWAKFSLAKEQRAAGKPVSGKRVTTDTIEVDGRDRPTRTSKGTLIYPTEEGVRNFWRWFKDSKFVDDSGRPLVMYHGTARNIDEFIPGPTGAIFITPQQKFAGGFAFYSEDWMAENYEGILDADKIEAAKLKALREIDPLTKKDYRLTKDSHHSKFVETSEFIEALKDQMPSKANIIPLFVSGQNMFDFDNEAHVGKVVDSLFKSFGIDTELEPNETIRFEDLNNAIADKNYSEDEIRKLLNRGYWPLIEQVEVQDAIRDAGFDSFSVKETGVKNYAVYEPNQVKSAVGNNGEFSQKKSIRYSLKDKPKFAYHYGDLRAAGDTSAGAMVGRSTGHFGTGVYFYGNELPSDTVNKFGRSQRSLHVVDLSKYKLYRPEDYRTGRNLHEALRKVNRLVYRDYDNNDVNEAAIDVWTRMGSRENNEETIRKIIKSAVEDTRAELDAKDALHSREYIPSASTRVVQALGWDGIDVRGIEGLDSGDYGTVVYGDKLEPEKKYSLKDKLTAQFGRNNVASIEAKTTAHDSRGFIRSFIDSVSPETFSSIRQKAINKYNAIEKNSKRVAEIFGPARLLADASAIASALHSDRAAGVAASAFKQGVPVYSKGYVHVEDFNGQERGLLDILEPLGRYGDPFVYQAYQFYAATRRGARLLVEGREKLLTPSDIRFGRQLEKQYPEFKQIFDEYQDYNKNFVKLLVDTGVLSVEDGKKWMMYSDYIPFYRQDEGKATVGPALFSNFSGIKPTPMLKGGEAPLAPFLDTVVLNARAAISQAMKAVAAQRAVRDAMDLNTPGTNDYAERLPAGAQGGGDVVVIRENGKDVKYRVADPLWLEAMKGLYAQNPYKDLMKVLGFPARMLRNIITKMPDFIVRNMFRDSASAWVTSGMNFIPLLDTFKQFGKIVANISPEADALARAGIASGYDFSGDIKSTSKEFGKELRRRGGKRTFAERAMLPFTAVWDGLESASNASDKATRAEIYKRTMIETNGNEAEAANRALEVMNFSRMGSSPIVQLFAAMTPFLNARIQGMDVLYRAGMGELAQANKDAAFKAFKVRMLTMIALGFAYAFMVSGDDDYEAENQEVKDNNYFIGNLKFPIPFEVGFLTKVIPERIVAYLRGQDTGKDFIESMRRNIQSTLSMNIVPQALLPLWEIGFDRSTFTGRPIIPMGQKDVVKIYQQTPQTTGLAKYIGQKAGVSPIEVDHVINGYFGALGGYVASAISAAMHSIEDPSVPAKPVERMPFVKAFARDPSPQGQVNAFYDLNQAIDEAQRTLNVLQKTGRFGELNEFFKENGTKLLALKGWAASLEKDLKRINEQEKILLAAPEKYVSSEEKGERLEALRKAKAQIASRAREVRKHFVSEMK